MIMKKLTRNIIAAAVVAGSLFSVSCKKALEEKVYSFISPNNFYKNGSDAVVAVNGIYSELYTYDLYIQPFWNLTLLDDDHVSGADWYLGSAGAGNPNNYWGVERPWSGLYIVIARANTVLENVPGITADITPELKNRVLGEAYFLRGWAYFQLVQLYGGVPLRLKTLGADPQTNTPRASVAEVYNAVISDLKQAETLLYPANDTRSGEAGRVTRGVAMGYLAKVYATIGSASLKGGNVAVYGGNDNQRLTYAKTVLAGYEGFDSKAYYKLSMDKAKELIDSKQYDLFDNWKDIWNRANFNKREHMWEIQSLTGTSFINDLHAYFTAGSYPFGMGAVWMTNNHYKTYEEDKDTRALDGVSHQYVAYRQTNPGGTRYYYPSWEAAKYSKDAAGNVYNNDGKGDDKAFITKYSSVQDETVSNSDMFFPVMRYSEILLLYAEAANEAGSGPDAGAYQYLNAVRSRSHATDAPLGMSQEEFRSFVLEERGREFSLENIRRYDLIRWGIYLPVMNAITKGQNNISKVRNTRNLLLPIPVSEMNTNKAITQNNPGW